MADPTSKPSLRSERILVTGPTSQVGLPLVRALAADNEVYGLARLRKQADRDTLENIGVKPVAVDLAEDDLASVPDDCTYVINLAVVKSGRFDYDLAANAEGVGRLMARCRAAKAFLHGSSAAVYQYTGSGPLAEDAPLGDNHRALFPTYSISKIAAETMVRFAARQWNIPTIIARFSVPYGDNGGWPWFHLAMMQAGHAIPIHPDRPNLYNLIHEEDYIAQVPALLAAATVPATTINWGGSEAVSIEQWCEYLGELTGLTPEFEETEQTIPPLPVEVSRMREIAGPTHVDWRQGMRRIVERSGAAAGAGVG
jgi:UDP-glucuronate 4-epimerase